MTQPDKLDADVAHREVTLGDLLHPILKHRRAVLLVTLVATILATLAAGFVYVRQGMTQSAALGFRATFPDAVFGIYPNGQPFVPSDVVSREVVEAVAKTNHVDSYCSVDAFRSGLVVLESSAELETLNAAFESHLTDPRLTSVERQRVADEYASRRASMPTQFEMRYLQPPSCPSLPDAVLTKTLPDILQTWARETQQLVGVMRFDLPVLTPALFDEGEAAGTDLLVRADLLRTALTRVIANIHDVELLPGAGQVRGGDAQVSLPEVRARLEDLMQARLDPLFAEIGHSPQARAWMEQALQAAKAEAEAAQKRAAIYYTALHEYTRGVPASPTDPLAKPLVPPEAAMTPAPGTSSATPSPAAQVDSALVDRIVELSAASMAFRQELTRQAIASSVEATNRGLVVDHYARLVAAPGSGGTLTPPAINTALAAIRAAAKEATGRFNDIYAELSRISLREGASLYRIEQPVEVGAVGGESARHLAALIVSVLFGTPLVLALVLLLQFHATGWVGDWRRSSLRK
jgi:hypothetical protein